MHVAGGTRGADYPIRCPAVAADDWGITSRLDTALEACCGVSHALDLQRSSSQRRTPGAKSTLARGWRVDRVCAPHNGGGKSRTICSPRVAQVSAPLRCGMDA